MHLYFLLTVHLDPTWLAITEYAREELGQGKTDDPASIEFVYDKFDETAIRRIIDKQQDSMKRQKQEKVKHIKGSLIIFDDLSQDGEMKKHQAGINAELFITSRHHGLSLIASVHSATSLGSLARRQICTLVVFGIGNSREYQRLSDQYSQLAGRDKSVFDAIYDLMRGPFLPSQYTQIRAILPKLLCCDLKAG